MTDDAAEEDSGSRNQLLRHASRGHVRTEGELLVLARLWAEGGLVNAHCIMQAATLGLHYQPVVMAGGNTFRSWAGKRSSLLRKGHRLLQELCSERGLLM